MLTNLETSIANLYNKIQHANTKNIKVIYKGKFNNLTSHEQKHFDHYPYMKMNIKDKAIHEYKFAFGHLDVKEQHLFMMLLLKLQEYKLIKPPKKMYGINRFVMDSNYILKLSRSFIKLRGKLAKPEHGNRVSLYTIDINIVNNLCILFPKLNGYVYLHKKSIWHPKMDDTSEVAVFDITNTVK